VVALTLFDIRARTGMISRIAVCGRDGTLLNLHSVSRMPMVGRALSAQHQADSPPRARLLQATNSPAFASTLKNTSAKSTPQASLGLQCSQRPPPPEELGRRRANAS
jgi:hypothetical protein